jgi:hypothetical protein
VPIATTQAGPVTITRTATDNVGHSTTSSCTTQVRQSPPEFGRCVKLPGEKVGKKTVYRGLFSAATCLSQLATPTGRFEWISGVGKKAFTTTRHAATSVRLETVNGTLLKCTNETTTGTITSAKTLGNVVVRFIGCTNLVEAKCTSPGRAAGELQTNTLEGVLGIERTVVKGAKEVRYAALDLYPPGRAGAFLEYNCEGQPRTLTGSVIGPITDDKMSAGPTFTHVTKHGKQTPESFAGGQTDVLSTNLGEQVALADTLTFTPEETLEINAFY